MSVFTNAADLNAAPGACTTSQVPAVLDKNWQTTAAVAATIASGGVAGGIMLAAFPAQTLAAGVTIGGLAYAGKRRADGLAPLPFIGKKDDKSSDDTETKADDTVAAA